VCSFFSFDGILFQNMVRTRGGAFSNVDYVRPTVSVRRKRGGPSISVANEDFKENIEQDGVKIDDEGFPGWLVDKSLLINYEDHVAIQL